MIYKGVTVSLFSVSLCSIRKVIVNNLARNMSSGRPQVYVTRSDMPECGIEKLKKQFDVKMWHKPSPVPRDELLKSVAGIDALFCTLSDTINKELLDAAGPNLKVVSTISVGHDHIDLAECKKRGVRIGYTANTLTDATAELAVALLLSTSRRLPEAQHEAKTGGWVSWAPKWMIGPGLAGSTVGIVGFGNIGIAIATRLKSFKTSKILYYSRSEKAEAKELGAIKVSFDEILAQSDFIICSIALTPETKGMFDKSAFAKMKKSAVFVNISRGVIVDQDALIEALQNKTIFGAGLDVTTPEPLPLDSPLFKLNNCVVLPHIGSATIDTRDNMSTLTADNIIAGINNTKMPAEL